MSAIQRQLNHSMGKISDLQRDYLAEIYLAQQMQPTGNNDVVSSADLAARLHASQSTVNRVIERLRKADLIRHQRYVGVQLTPSGKREALALLRKQGIIEAFLVVVMGMGWHEVYDEARRMRHRVAGVLLDRMWQMAGQPTISPFGEPLTLDDTVANDAEVRLTEADTTQDYQIARVLTRESDRLEYLAALGLTPGTHLHLLHQAPFNGPIQIHLERQYRIIGHGLACMLTVIPGTELHDREQDFNARKS